MLSPNFAVLGSLINIAGCIAYLSDTLKGKAKPNRVSWSLWSVAPFIAFGAELTQGFRVQSLITLSAGLGPALVLAASFTVKKAYWKIKPFDWYCAALSVLALSLWLITGKGDIAIVFSICADLLACIPTGFKAYTHPETESASAFGAGFIGTSIGLLSTQHWTFPNYAFPAYLVILNGGIACIITLRKHVKSKANANL